jgi:YbbR domain-containing protein
MGLIPGVLSRNWQQKLSAFAIALLLWVTVRVDSANRQSIPARVDVELTDPAWSLVGEPLPGTVQVLFGGPTREILRVAVEGTSVRIPIEFVSAPDTSIGLRSDWVTTDGFQGLVVQDIRPATVRLHFEMMETVDRPLALHTRGSLDESIGLVQPLVVVPASVRLRGPASRLAGIDTVFLTELDLGSVRESESRVLPVDRAGITDVILSPDSGTVRIQVEESAERVLALAIAADDPGEGALELSDDTVRVRVVGARSRIQGLDPSMLRAVVAAEDLAQIAPGQERWVLVRLEGLPDLVRALPDADSVVARRSAAS